MATQPLADRMRPTSFDDIAGQVHLVSKNGILRKLTENGRIPNMVFFGPPGTGKTTVANIIAKASPHMSLGSIPTHVIASEAWQSPKDRLLKIATALAEPRNDVLKQSLAMTY